VIGEAYYGFVAFPDSNNKETSLKHHIQIFDWATENLALEEVSKFSSKVIFVKEVNTE
jgi:hypothetical protein